MSVSCAVKFRDQVPDVDLGVALHSVGLHHPVIAHNESHQKPSLSRYIDNLTFKRDHLLTGGYLCSGSTTRMLIMYSIIYIKIIRLHRLPAIRDWVQNDPYMPFSEDRLMDAYRLVLAIN